MSLTELLLTFLYLQPDSNWVLAPATVYLCSRRMMTTAARGPILENLFGRVMWYNDAQDFPKEKYIAITIVWRLKHARPAAKCLLFTCLPERPNSAARFASKMNEWYTEDSYRLWVRPAGQQAEKNARQL